MADTPHADTPEGDAINTAPVSWFERPKPDIIVAEESLEARRRYRAKEHTLDDVLEWAGKLLKQVDTIATTIGGWPDDEPRDELRRALKAAAAQRHVYRGLRTRKVTTSPTAVRHKTGDHESSDSLTMQDCAEGPRGSVEFSRFLATGSLRIHAKDSEGDSYGESSIWLNLADVENLIAFLSEPVPIVKDD